VRYKYHDRMAVYSGLVQLRNLPLSYSIILQSFIPTELDTILCAGNGFVAVGITPGTEKPISEDRIFKCTHHDDCLEIRFRIERKISRIGLNLAASHPDTNQH